LHSDAGFANDVRHGLGEGRQVCRNSNNTAQTGAAVVEHPIRLQISALSRTGHRPGTHLFHAMRLNVNAREHELDPAPHEVLADTLSDRLSLTGTKIACGRGECGACTVLLDGAPVYSCLTLTIACDGSRVETVEGIGTPQAMHPVQDAFVSCDAVQCGFCTPGQIMSAVALLRRDTNPDDQAIERAMSGNLCRCGTYPNIVRAIHAAAAVMNQQGVAR